MTEKKLKMDLKTERPCEPAQIRQTAAAPTANFVWVATPSLSPVLEYQGIALVPHLKTKNKKSQLVLRLDTVPGCKIEIENLNGISCAACAPEPLMSLFFFKNVFALHLCGLQKVARGPDVTMPVHLTLKKKKKSHFLKIFKINELITRMYSALRRARVCVSVGVFRQRLPNVRRAPN